MAITPEMMRRLAFAKYLFNVADEQARGPEILAAISLLGYHDATELFLKAACDQAGKDPGKKATFEDYWTALAKAFPPPLPQQAAMRPLNAARISLKHHGNLPAASDLQGFRVICREFFSEATPLFFGVEFADISLVEFVEPESARNYLNEARQQLNTRLINEAAISLSAAFQVMLRFYSERSTRARRLTPVTFRDFHASDFESPHISGSPNSAVDWRRFAQKLNEGLGPLHTAVQLLTLGLDLRKFQVFAITVPEVSFSEAGKLHSHGIRREASAAELEFCFDYVVQSAIKLRTFDADIDPL